MLGHIVWHAIDRHEKIIIIIKHSKEMADEYYLISFINLPFLKMVPNGTTQGCFCPLQYSQYSLTLTTDT